MKAPLLQLFLLLALSGASYGGYKDVSRTISSEAELEDCVDSKKNFYLTLTADINTTAENTSKWTADHLFSLSNYYFSSAESTHHNLRFDASAADNIGKVFRNGRVVFDGLGNIEFADIHNTQSNSDFTTGSVIDQDVLTSYGYGGVMCGYEEESKGGAVFQNNNGTIAFRDIRYDTSTFGDVSCSIHVYGGAIYTESSQPVSFTQNRGAISFSKVGIREQQTSNYSYRYFHAEGGAIIAANIAFSENEADIDFDRCYIHQSAAEGDEGNALGGALYLKGSDNVFSDNTGNITFSDNFVSVVDSAQGGAIYLNGALDISGNADIDFSGNSVTAADTAIGGAIRLSDNSSLSISNNKNVIFLNNKATLGGAISAGHQTHISLHDNRGAIVFEGNEAESGSSIHTHGTLSIRNNAAVSFCDTGNAPAVYMSVDAAAEDAAHLILSAARNDTIAFESALYAESTGSGAFRALFNADLDDGTEQSGRILFTGTDSTIAGKVTLCNGLLELRDQATLTCNSLSIEQGEVALSGASSLHATSMQLAEGATLSASGTGNTIYRVDMDTNAILSLALSAANLTDAVLHIESLLSTYDTYTLDIDLLHPLAAGSYTLLTLPEELPYSENAWNEDTIRVTGELTFSDLHWEDNYTRLVYSVPEPTNLLLPGLMAFVIRRRRR